MLGLIDALPAHNPDVTLTSPALTDTTPSMSANLAANFDTEPMPCTWSATVTVDLA